MPRPTAIAQFINARFVISLTLAATAAGAAFAQTPASPDQAPQEVVVTGSRIPAPNLESTSPIQVVTQQDIKIGGRLDITDVINQLPQNFSNSLGQDLGNRTSGLTTAGGVSTADLRGLGPNRTLVLVNGRRLGQGSPNTAIASPGADLDQIPSYLLERVDVVTGGASATYGSDAIAGVINFVLKKNFEGFQVDYQLGENFHKNDNAFAKSFLDDSGVAPSFKNSARDGRNQTVNVLAGTNFADGRGNITAYFGYMNADPVTSGDRDFGGCQLALNGTGDGASCTGSLNSNYFKLASAPTEYTVVGNQFIDNSTAAANAADPPVFFNSQRFIYMARQDTRYNAGFLGHLELSDYVQPYVEFGFMNDKTHQVIAPAALFRDSNPTDPAGNYNINCSNPLLSAQQAGILCSAADIAADAADPGSVSANVRIGRRNVEGGGRSSDYEHTNYRAVLGTKGDLLKGWSYDGYGSYYYTQFYQTNNKYESFNAINNALQVTTGANGPECISGGSCVPYNIFTQGGVTQDQVNYLQVAGTSYGTVTERIVHADLTGDLGQYGIKLPTANDGLGINFGFEHRTDTVHYGPDAAELSGDLSGAGGASVAINNSLGVSEEFVEVRAPLMQDRPGVKDLVFDTGLRRSDYDSAAGVVNTHKFELQYAPVDDIRFRGSFQKAIRAPTIVELFNPQLVGQISFGATGDPCAPYVDPQTHQTKAAASSAAACANTGVTAAQYGNGLSTNTIPQGTAGQLSQLQGGNPDLTAESAKTYTIGMTLTPTFLPNFTGSLDYYNIKLKHTVGSLAASSIVQNCLDTADPVYCSQIIRSPVTGGLTGASVASKGYIVQTNVNIGAVDTDGLDVQAGYKLPIGEHWGSLTFGLSGVYLLSSKTTQIEGGPQYDCAGLFGFTCQTINPKWHHLFRTTWEMPWNTSLSLNWRYLGEVKNDNNDGQAELHFKVFPFVDKFNDRIPAYNYLDLAGSWNIKDDIQVRAGINNILDKDPPIVTTDIVSGGAANTYEIYDGLGRQAFIAATMKF